MAKGKKQNQPSQQVRNLKAASERAHEAGDYCRVREISLEIQGLTGDSAESRQAAYMYSQLGVDKVVIQFGAGVIFLYLSGWALAFF